MWQGQHAHEYWCPQIPEEGMTPFGPGVKGVVNCLVELLGTQLKSSSRAVMFLTVELSFQPHSTKVIEGYESKTRYSRHPGGMACGREA